MRELNNDNFARSELREAGFGRGLLFIALMTIVFVVAALVCLSPILIN